ADAEAHRRRARPLHRDGRLGGVAAAAGRPLLGLTEQPVPPYPHVGEEQLTRRRRVQPHLAQWLALLEPGEATVEHEVEHLTVLGFVALVELADEHGGVRV